MPLGLKLLVFLGAGVSTPSGLPTALELTDGLLAPTDLETEASTRIRAFLRLIAEHDTEDIRRVANAVAIYRGDRSTYEDLFFLCQQFSLWSMGLSDHSQTTPLLESLEQRAGDLLEGSDLRTRLGELAKLGTRACSFIEAVVARTLDRPYLSGLDLLAELSADPRVGELNIVTLNHDTLVEQFLSSRDVKFVDGFGEPDGEVRWSDDGVYDRSGARVRILKLHGSVNWYAFPRSGLPRTAIFTGADRASAHDGAGNALRAEYASPSFLSGINKSVAYHRGFYADVHFRFLDLLRRCDRIVMSGYGWGDTAINFQLETWLDRSRQNRLVLLHEQPRQLRYRSMMLMSAYDAWIRSGQLVALERWLSATSMADLSEHLA